VIRGHGCRFASFRAKWHFKLGRNPVRAPKHYVGVVVPGDVQLVSELLTNPISDMIYIRTHCHNQIHVVQQKYKIIGASTYNRK